MPVNTWQLMLLLWLQMNKYGKGKWKIPYSASQLGATLYLPHFLISPHKNFQNCYSNICHASIFLFFFFRRNTNRELQWAISNICVGNLLSRARRYLIRAEKLDAPRLCDQSRPGRGGRWSRQHYLDCLFPHLLLILFGESSGPSADLHIQQ